LKPFLIILAASLLFISCKNEKASISENKNDSYVPESKDPYVINTQKLLQGTWNSLDENGVSVEFDKNTRVENIKGQPKGKTRYFKITDKCDNESSGEQQVIRAKAKYISMQDIDMCFYIIKLSKDQLELKVMGRGNILKYRKKGSKRSSNKSLKIETSNTK